MTNATVYSVNETDWKLPDNLPTRTKRSRTVYNQDNLDPYACFYAAPISAAFDVYERRGEKVDWIIRQGWDTILKYGLFTPKYGGKFSDGVDVARRIYNAAYPSQKVATYRTEVGSPQFFAAIAKGWSPCVGRWASRGDVADINEDGDLDNNVKVSGSFGHLFRVEPGLVAVDNYPSKPGFKNRYILTEFDKKVGSGLFFPYAYFFLPA